MVPRDKTKIRKRQDEDVCPLQRGSGTLWHNCGCRSRASHKTSSWDTITPGSFPTRQKELLSHPKQSTDADLLKEVSFYLVLENFKVFLSFKTRFHISPPDLKRACAAEDEVEPLVTLFPPPKCWLGLQVGITCSVCVVQGWEGLGRGWDQT